MSSKTKRAETSAITNFYVNMDKYINGVIFIDKQKNKHFSHNEEFELQYIKGNDTL